jgi:hypothetical protein
MYPENSEVIIVFQMSAWGTSHDNGAKKRNDEWQAKSCAELRASSYQVSPCLQRKTQCNATNTT